MAKKTISFSPTGIIGLYFDKIKEDIIEHIRSNHESYGYCKIGSSLIMKRLIEESFLLKYGEEARKEIRNEYYKDVFAEINQQNNMMSLKHDKNRQD